MAVAFRRIAIVSVVLLVLSWWTPGQAQESSSPMVNTECRQEGDAYICGNTLPTPPEWSVPAFPAPSETCVLTIEAPDHRRACFTFTPDGLTYTGDLPPVDAAKLFFESVNWLVCTQTKAVWSGMAFGTERGMMQLGARADGVVVWRLQEKQP